MYPVRHLNLHEYQSKKLMESYKINTQRFEIAETPEEAGRAAKNLGKCLKRNDFLAHECIIVEV